MKDPIRFSVRDSEPLTLLQQKYAQYGYHAKLGEEDQIFLAYEGTEIIALVRLVVENGISVLRGMYMDESYHRRGIGTAMLGFLVPFLNEGHTPCYCVPFTHLTSFYGLIGFVEYALESAPGFLQTRVKEYRQEGMDSILMVRKTF